MASPPPITAPLLEVPKPRDARKIAKIEAAAWRRAYRTLLPEGALQSLGTEERVFRWMNRIRFQEGDVQIGIIRSQGIVAGYASFGPARYRDLGPGFAGEVYELYIDPTMQGQGLGRRLLRGTHAELRRNGFHWAVLEVLRDNRAARGFYEATGMQTEGRTRRRPSGFRSTVARGLRYSTSGSAVAVVRYEAPLHAIAW